MRRWFLPAMVGILALVMLSPTMAGAGSRTSAARPAASGDVSPMATGHTLAPIPPCPSEDFCQTIPQHCPSGQTCPTIEAGPVTELGPNQWVYVSAYGFPAGTFLHLNYCSDAPPLTSYCATNSTAQLVNALYVVQTFSDGTTSLSYQVEEVQQGDSPISGAVPGASPAQTGTFVCNDSTPCAIDVTDTGTDNSQTPLPSATNTAVIPVAFEPATNGCPTATTVGTESEFGLDVLLPEASRLSCQDPSPVLAFNTAIDGLTAVTSLEGGEVQMAFTDDPEQADQQDQLKKGNFALIPIALSATVIGFKAQQLGSQVLYPDNALDLTPNMVAGLITSYYSSPSSDPTGKVQLNDSVSCSVQGCRIPPCISTNKKTHPTLFCSLIPQLNYSAGFAMPQQFGGFVRSDNAGSVGLSFSWLCNAPNAPVLTPLSQTYTETQTAAQVLEYGLGTQNGIKITPLASCPDGDQFPPSSSAVHYTSANDPSQQALKMNSYVGPGLGGTNANAGFGPINWADARYFGLGIAALQNPAGEFVLPTPSSVDAAVADATTNPDGSLTPNYTTADKSAYPMPTVVYAAVCADPVPDAQASAERGLLTQLLDLTAGADTSKLPDGFIPLPSSVTAQAQSDISKDIVGGGSADGGCPPGGGAAGASAGPGGSGSSGSSVSSVSPTPPTVIHGGSPSAVFSHPVTVTGPHSNLPTGGQSSGNTGSGHALVRHGPTVLWFTLPSSADQAIVPLVIILAMIALCMGGLLLLSGGLRRSVTEAMAGMRTEIRRGSSALRRRSSTILGPGTPVPPTRTDGASRTSRPWSR